MKRVENIIIAFGALLLVACGGQTPNSTPTKLVVPTPPAMLTDPASRADFVMMHYWDNYDFADTALVHNAEYTEQAMANYINIMSAAPAAAVSKGIKAMLTRAIDSDSVVFAAFCDMYEKYLADPNSPMRNEECYIPVLEFIIASPKIDALSKIAPEATLSLAMKNRQGEKAIDFEYTTDKGGKGRLYGIKSPYIFLFFNHPDCPDCIRVKEVLSSSPLFVHAQKEGLLKILAIFPDDDLTLWRAATYPKEWINARNNKLTPDAVYDLKASPTLYLLGEDKTVLLKDAQVELIEQYLMQQLQPQQPQQPQ